MPVQTHVAIGNLKTPEKYFLRFEIEMHTNTTGNNLVQRINALGAWNPTTELWEQSALVYFDTANASTVYSWRARVIDMAGNPSSWSAWVTGSTAIPPGVITPLTGTTQPLQGAALDSSQILLFRDEFLVPTTTGVRPTGISMAGAYTVLHISDYPFPNVGVNRFAIGSAVNNALSLFLTAEGNLFTKADNTTNVFGFLRLDNTAGWENLLIFKFPGFRIGATAQYPLAPASNLRVRWGASRLALATTLNDTDSVVVSRNSGISSGFIAAAPTGVSRTSNVTTLTLTAARPADWGVGQDLYVNGVTDATFNGMFKIVSLVSTNAVTYANTGANATSGSGTADAGGDVNFFLRVYKVSVLQSEQDLGFRPDTDWHRWKMWSPTAGTVKFQQDNGTIFSVSSNLPNVPVIPRLFLNNAQTRTPFGPAEIDLDYWHFGYINAAVQVNANLPRWQGVIP